MGRGSSFADIRKGQKSKPVRRSRKFFVKYLKSPDKNNSVGKKVSHRAVRQLANVVIKPNMTHRKCMHIHVFENRSEMFKRH